MSIRIGILKERTLKTIFVSYPKDIYKTCKLLNENYKKVTLIEDLIKEGDIHCLNNSKDTTIFFSRDRNDPYEVCKAYEETAESLELIDTDKSPVDYYLIFTNKWNICESYSNQWTSVNKFIKKKK